MFFVGYAKATDGAVMTTYEMIRRGPEAKLSNYHYGLSMIKWALGVWCSGNHHQGSIQHFVSGKERVAYGILVLYS